MCLLIVAAYTSAIKSNLIKQPEQKLITKISQIPDSKIPIIYVSDDPENFATMRESEYLFDKWVHDNVREVVPFTDQ